MARPKSEEKRNKLLSVAAQVFAKGGLSAPTAAITSAAGMAEGTLFIYFKSKDDLIHALYEEVKNGLGEAMLSSYPQKASVRARVKHIWNKYIDWGMEHPDEMAVLNKIKVWEGLRADVRNVVTAQFAEIYALIDTAIHDGTFQNVPPEFVHAMIAAQAETTMHFMRQHPQDAECYKGKGFEICWNGITRQT